MHLLILLMLLISCERKTPLDIIEENIGIPLKKAKITKEITSKHAKHYEFDIDDIDDIEQNSPISKILNGENCKIVNFNFVKNEEKMYFIKDAKNKVIGICIIFSNNSPVQIMIQISNLN